MEAQGYKTLNRRKWVKTTSVASAFNLDILHGELLSFREHLGFRVFAFLGSHYEGENIASGRTTEDDNGKTKRNCALVESMVDLHVLHAEHGSCGQIISNVPYTTLPWIRLFSHAWTAYLPWFPMARGNFSCNIRKNKIFKTFVSEGKLQKCRFFCFVFMNDNYVFCFSAVRWLFLMSWSLGDALIFVPKSQWTNGMQVTKEIRNWCKHGCSE